MSGTRSQRGVPLPRLWQAIVVAAAVTAVALLWSEFRRGNQPAANGAGQADHGAKLRSMLDLSRESESAVAELTAYLQSDDRRTRRNALLALADMGPRADEALDAVRQRLSDQDSSVRQSALLAFSKICADRDEIATVTAGFLADPEKHLRDFAAGSLETAGPSAIPALIDMAHSDSGDTRQLVIRLLPQADKHRDPGEVNAALRSLFDDPDGTVRLQAIKAVVGRGAATVDEIDGWLREHDPSVVAAGLRAVSFLGPEAADVILPNLRALLEKGDGAKSGVVLSAISHFKAGAAPLIPVVLRRVSESSSGGGFQVARTLVEIGAQPADVVPILIALLASEKQAYNDCWQAGELLARIDPEEARRQVSRLIGKITAKENEPMEHQDSDLNALSGLGSQAQEAVPLLIRLLSHPSRAVPPLAMSALYRLGPGAAPAVPALLTFIDRDGSAIDTLGRIGPTARSAVPHLLKLIDDPRLGNHAASALGQIGDASPEVLAALRRQLRKESQPGRPDIWSRSRRTAAIESLVLLDGDSATTRSGIMSLLSDDDGVRTAAITAIGRLSGDRRQVIEPLIKSLAADDNFSPAAAALALGQIGPDAKAALPALRRIAADRRNAVAKSFQHWPSEKVQRQVSLAEAAQWAISAIEAPTP